MKDKNKGQSGFTLLETIITMGVFTIIMLVVYTMIMHYGDVSKTEYSRVKQHQESRYMASSFASELKEAGSALTLTHTAGLLQDTPYFNGIMPLNSTTFPDGMIIATGDPEAVTTLSKAYTPSATSLNVENASVPAHDPSNPTEIPQWDVGQKGILIHKGGFYVFYVSDTADTGTNIIKIRQEPVYYSGQLSITGAGYFNYDDDLGSGTSGDTITYAVKTPVIRLTNFSIYLFREVTLPGPNRKIRQLIRVTDTKGQTNPLADGTTAEVSVISENIYDMQISYIAYDDFSTAVRGTAIDPDHHYFATDSSTNATLSNLMIDIRARKLKQIDIDIVSITDDFGGKGEITLKAPALGDQAAYNLPEGKYGIELSSISIDPRNFNIIL